MRKVMRKYRLSFSFYRHVHFELSSILREFNTIFGLQMVLQLVSLHFCGVFFFIRCYQIFTSEKTHLFVIDVVYMISWALRCLLDIIVLNHTCEIVCKKVNFRDILEKLSERDKLFIYEDARGY